MSQSLITPVAYQEGKLLLLDQTRLPLAEVADRSGFSDVSYFCRVIRRAVGVSPGSFRAH